MNLILFDDPQVRVRLLPLTHTRPVAELRVGILTIREKWERISALKSSTLTDDYLLKKFPLKVEKENFIVNGSVCPDPLLWDTIHDLKPGEGLFSKGVFIAARVGDDAISYPFDFQRINEKEYTEEIAYIERPWHMFLSNGDQIKQDFALITKDRESRPIDDKHTSVYNPENIFLEEGVKIRAAILNAENGPIYIGKNAEFQEGSIVQGTGAFCEGSVISMGAKIRDNTTIGPFSKVGGEVKNSIIIGFSNKSHEGFLGNSVIGEWCNIGADANSSNLKNNYDNVRVWDYETERFIDSGHQFNGMVMGDHSKIGINSMINTGTVIGVGANIYGSGFPRNFITSFSWGGAGGFTEYRLDKFKEMIRRVLSRRGMTFDAIDEEIIDHVYSVSAKYRNFK